MEHGSIIDRKKLKNALTCRSRPVYHLLEVVELTYSKVILSTEGEDRNCSTCSLPVTAAETYLQISLYCKLILIRHIEEPSVISILPCNRIESLSICDENLIRERLRHIKGKIPYRELALVERNNLCPLLERLATSCKCKNLVRTERRCCNLDKYICILDNLS